MNNKSFSGEVSFKFGNFDYLMGNDVDLYHLEVRKDLTEWGKWFMNLTGVNGFRLDAVKHIPFSFFKDWLADIRDPFKGKEVLAVAEYWLPSLEELKNYINLTGGTTKIFDVPLHFNFFEAGQKGNEYDLRNIFKLTLVESSPALAVTFVDNHDSQAGSSLESFVDPWFKPIAYSLILLRGDGYPCVFEGDYHGGDSGGTEIPTHQYLIDLMLDVRKKYCYGDLHDYFDHPNCIGRLYTGDSDHPGAVAILISNGDEGTKRIKTFAPNAEFRDLTGHISESIKSDQDGYADFTCNSRTLSIWAQQ